MNKYDIYNDIAQRTSGNIYIGVVGPVRTGKSTFITRFMQEMVLPNIESAKLNETTLELPQSAQGKTIMTTEPKFVPSKGVSLTIDKMQANVRLIDCVGYLVSGAIGNEEEEKPRLVKTPWNDEPIPFEEAADIGTKKVINEHSTIGIVVTTDGSFTDIPRENYVDAEEKAINELKILGKPFVVVLNCQDPDSKKVQKIQSEMEAKYNIPVIASNVMTMDKSKFSAILETVLMEFPMCSFDVVIPEWMCALTKDNRIIEGLLTKLRENSMNVSSMRSFKDIETMFDDSDVFEPCDDLSFNMAKGVAKICLKAKKDVFYKVVSEECGENIVNEIELMQYVKELSEAKKNYVKLKGALECAESTGYGVVSPIFDETELSEPEVVKRAGGYSVKMKAKAKSLHIIRADIQADVTPVSGNKKQCDDFVEFLNNCDEGERWQADVFGKPLSSIICDEVSSNSQGLGDNVKYKLRKTLNRAVNEKKSNLFCILI